MAYKDAGEKLTEKELARLELKINRVYASASVDVKKELAKFRAEFSALDEQMAQMVDDGKLSEEHYKQWRLNQIGRGQRMKMMQETLASRMLNANEIATAYVNDATPSIYSLNWNYSAYVIDSIHGGVDLTLYDERTIRRLIKDSPNTMPNYPEEKAIERGIDMAYSQKVIANTVTQQILTGKTLKQMSEHLQKTFVNMELKSALRTARTSFTSAQNGGRLDCMMSAEAKGIDVKKQWFTARDNRVRDSHMEVNAEIKPLKKPFGNDLMFPADPKGRPSEVYNCRCTLLYVVDGKSVLDPMMQSPTDFEDFKNWMKNKGQPLRSPVPLPSKYNPDTYVPASTLKEAEEKISKYVDKNKFGGLGVSYTGVSLDVANEINKTLINFFETYKFDNFGGIIAPAGNTKLGKLITSATAGYSSVRDSFVLNRKSLKTMKAVKETMKNERDVIDDIFKHPEKYDLSRLSPRVRAVVERSRKSGRSTVPDTLPEVIYHELGHKMEKEIYKHELWQTAEKNMNDWADKISGYAGESKSEYIAESFASYNKGEKIDPVMQKIFDSLRR